MHRRTRAGAEPITTCGQGEALTGSREVAREADASSNRLDDNDMALVHRQNSARLLVTIMRSRPPSAQDQRTPASTGRAGAPRPLGAAFGSLRALSARPDFLLYHLDLIVAKYPNMGR